MNIILEQDLRGDTCLAILGFLAWADAHGRVGMVLDGSVAAWLADGKPEDRQLRHACLKLRSQLARYVDRGGHVPEWFPASLLKAIGEPWCADEISAASVTAPPSESEPTTTGQRCASVAIVPENNPEPKGRKTMNTQRKIP